MNTYKLFWKRHTLELKASTSLEAQQQAFEVFKSKGARYIKRYDITAVLVAKGGQQISHSTQFAGE